MNLETKSPIEKEPDKNWLEKLDSIDDDILHRTLELLKANGVFGND